MAKVIDPFTQAGGLNMGSDVFGFEKYKSGVF